MKIILIIFMIPLSIFAEEGTTNIDYAKCMTYLKKDHYLPFQILSNGEVKVSGGKDVSSSKENGVLNILRATPMPRRYKIIKDSNLNVMEIQLNTTRNRMYKKILEIRSGQCAIKEVHENGSVVANSHLCKDVHGFFDENPEFSNCFDRKMNNKMLSIFEKHISMHSLRYYDRPLKHITLRNLISSASKGDTSSRRRRGKSPIVAGSIILQRCFDLGLEPFFNDVLFAAEELKVLLRKTVSASPLDLENLIQQIMDHPKVDSVSLVNVILEIDKRIAQNPSLGKYLPRIMAHPRSDTFSNSKVMETAARNDDKLHRFKELIPTIIDSLKEGKVRYREVFANIAKKADKLPNSRKYFKEIVNNSETDSDIINRAIEEIGRCADKFSKPGEIILEMINDPKADSRSLAQAAWAVTINPDEFPNKRSILREIRKHPKAKKKETRYSIGLARKRRRSIRKDKRVSSYKHFLCVQRNH